MTDTSTASARCPAISGARCSAKIPRPSKVRRWSFSDRVSMRSEAGRYSMSIEYEVRLAGDRTDGRQFRRTEVDQVEGAFHPEGVDLLARGRIGSAEHGVGHGWPPEWSPGYGTWGVAQLLRPRLGLRPWLAFLRRAEAFCLLVRFDMAMRVTVRAGYPSGRRRAPVTAPWTGGPAHLALCVGPDVVCGSVMRGRRELSVERFGFVGLPNAGKSSLYNALAGGGALAAPYAFATTEPNIGVARVPDGRLGRLAEMSASRKVVPTSVEFADIGGLVEGASQGEGLGNKFLAGIREVDAIVFVLRAFRDSDVPGPTDPLEHLRVVEVELALADLETCEKQVDKLRRTAKGDPSLRPMVDALGRAVDLLGEGTPLYRSDLTADERFQLKPFFLLTDKPVLAVVNLDEEQVEDPDPILAPVVAELAGAEVIGMCVQLEAEAALLSEEDRVEMLEGLGLGEGAWPRFVRAAYHLLGLRTYFTTGEKESRAWTFRAGSSAPECAGRIHTDFQRGFIRAETIGCEVLLEKGSWVSAREAGLVRSEGRDYLPVDGDVMEFRFNV